MNDEQKAAMAIVDRLADGQQVRLIVGHHFSDCAEIVLNADRQNLLGLKILDQMKKIINEGENE